VAALLAACGSSDPASETLSPGPDEIVIGHALAFTPAHLTVAVGTTVRWVNAGPFDHTVTSGASSNPADLPGADFDAELPPGGTFEVTFDTVGNHPFFCRFHESMGMKGIVTVAAPSGADAGTPNGNDSGDPGGGGGGGHGY
jgi:plastocyanin